MLSVDNNEHTWKMINEIDCKRWFYLNSNKGVKKENETIGAISNVFQKETLTQSHVFNISHVRGRYAIKRRGPMFYSISFLYLLHLVYNTSISLIRLDPHYHVQMPFSQSVPCLVLMEFIKLNLRSHSTLDARKSHRYLQALPIL